LNEKLFIVVGDNVVKYSFVPWVVLGMSIVVTTVVWTTIVDLDRKSQELEFNSLTEKSATQIEDHLKTHEQVLMGFQGLFLASYEVGPDEFTTFFNSQKIPDRFPDIQGVGYNEYVSGENEKNELVKRLTEYGLDFAIHPEGTRPVYVPVVYLEPQENMNKRAIGYDIYSEEIRKQAVDQVIKTGKTALTGKIILIQETSEDVQNGFLMLLPDYEYDEKTGSAKLKGFVTSVFRMNDFVESILGEHLFEYMEIKIFDGPPDPENLFFDSSNGKTMNEGNKFSKSIVIDFGGREWVLDFYGYTSQSDLDQSKWLIVPISGYSMSFLLFFAFILFSKNIQLTKNMMKREKIAIVGELASRFSHDIRNPLSVINTDFSMLKTEHPELDKESMERIERAIDRINHQVQSVLNFIKLKPSRLKNYSALELLKDVLGSMNIKKDIKINLPENDSHILCDKEQCEILFYNLIFNAIQELEEKGGTISIRIIEQDDFIIIEFEDSGESIPKENLDQIFDPLFTTKQSGTGLGLSSCKNIIEQFRGKISVKTNPTIFTLVFQKNENSKKILQEKNQI